MNRDPKIYPSGRANPGIPRYESYFRIRFRRESYFGWSYFSENDVIGRLEPLEFIPNLVNGENELRDPLSALWFFLVLVQVFF